MDLISKKIVVGEGIIRKFQFDWLLEYGAINEEIVWRVTDHISRRVYLLKRYKKTGAPKTYKNLKLLTTLKHINLAKSLNNFYEEHFIYVQLHFACTNMWKLKHLARRNSSILTDERCDWIIYQLFSVVSYLHQSGIILNKVWPSVFCIKADLSLVLCDLSETIFVASNKERTFADTEVAILLPYYSSLEQLFQGICTNKSDIFCLGLILLEMMAIKQGKSVGNIFAFDSFSQLGRFVDLLGIPSEEDLVSLKSKSMCVAVDEIKSKIKRKSALYRPKPLSYYLSETPTEILEMVKAMLSYSIKDRPQLDELVSHEYFRKYYSEGVLYGYPFLGEIEEIFKNAKELDDTQAFQAIKNQFPCNIERYL
eukprot:snap_masked-scaffold_8-processed-gene-13.34-mRNA-1 protein AED:1.00 eAED:1.00 QI:0/-1/0/0/-1/1/1/0/366